MKQALYKQQNTNSPTTIIIGMVPIFCSDLSKSEMLFQYLKALLANLEHQDSNFDDKAAPIHH